MGILCEILEQQQPRIKSSMKGLARGALIVWSLLYEDTFRLFFPDLRFLHKKEEEKGGVQELLNRHIKCWTLGLHHSFNENMQI